MEFFNSHAWLQQLSCNAQLKALGCNCETHSDCGVPAYRCRLRCTRHWTAEPGHWRGNVWAIDDQSHECHLPSIGLVSQHYRRGCSEVRNPQGWECRIGGCR